MAKNDMNFYATLEEAIDAAREVFLADNPDLESDDASVQQLSVQKYVLQDGDIMWQAEFFADEDDVAGANIGCRNNDLLPERMRQHY